MINLFKLFALCSLAGFWACQNQNSIPMCHDPRAAAVENFASFASDPAFRRAHPAPQPVTATTAGDMVEFPVAGGANGRAFLVKAAQPTERYLLMFHEWWGLNDITRNEAAYWSKELGINVMALDLYDGKLATTPEEAGKLMQSNDKMRSAAIIQGGAAYAGKKARFFTMGWCMGGGWSLQAALLLKNKVKGCVMYYGMPEKDLAKLKMLKTDVVFIHATKDKWINDEVVAEFERNMTAVRKKVTVHRYNADHAFANPSSPRYQEADAVAARAVVKGYLGR
jgi:carboxymethylenebutenolidase